MNEIQKELHAKTLTLGLGSYLRFFLNRSNEIGHLRPATVGHRSIAPAGTWLPHQVVVVFDVGLRE
jgi:hypothetical protein